MKKTLLLLLLSLSFSIHALSVTMVAPCESGDFKKEVEKRNNFDPLVNKSRDVPYLVDQHLLEK